MEGRRRYVVALGCLNEVSLMRTEREGDGRSAILSFGAVTIVCLPSTRAKSKREKRATYTYRPTGEEPLSGDKNEGKDNCGNVPDYPSSWVGFRYWYSTLCSRSLGLEPLIVFQALSLFCVLSFGPLIFSQVRKSGATLIPGRLKVEKGCTVRVLGAWKKRGLRKVGGI